MDILPICGENINDVILYKKSAPRVWEVAAKPAWGTSFGRILKRRSNEAYSTFKILPKLIQTNIYTREKERIRSDRTPEKMHWPFGKRI